MIAAAMALVGSMPMIAVFGQGGSSCAAAMEPANYRYARIWVMGYVSGLNSGTNGQVGQTTDGDGIMGEVRLVCEGQPSLRLIDAAAKVYLNMKTQKR